MYEASVLGLSLGINIGYGCIVGIGGVIVVNNITTDAGDLVTTDAGDQVTTG